MKRRTLKGAVAVAVVIVILTFVTVIRTAGFQRWWKSVTSNMGGGLNRVVYVYGMAGNLVRTYEGNIDIQDTSYGNKVLFDLDGKRIVLHNCSVIAEEKSE